MKNKWIFAAAALLTLALTSCMKDKPLDQETRTTRLAVKLTDADLASKAVEAPGAANQLLANIDLTRSFIYVFDQSGNLVTDNPVQITAAAMIQAPYNGVGQVLPEAVPMDARVYIVANIPTEDRAEVLTISSLNALQTYTSDIADQLGQFTKPVLANVGGTPTAIGAPTEVTLGEAQVQMSTVTVQIKPVISRLEVLAIQGGTDATGTINSFSVTGVYVDSYFPLYAYNGKLITEGNSSKEIGQLTDFSTWIPAMKDEPGPWASTTATPPVATAGTDMVWAYNVAPGGLPRPIIKVTNVQWTPAAGDTPVNYDAGDGSTVYYLTVGSYESLIGTFQPGEVYRIGGTGHELVFTPENLWATPNPEDVRLTVKVEVIDWQFNDYRPVLD